MMIPKHTYLPWPIAIRDIKAGLLRAIGDDQFRELRRLLRKRARNNRHYGKAHRSLVRKLRRLREGKTGSSHHYKHPLFSFWKKRSSPLLDALVDNRDRRWVNPLKRKKEATIVLKDFSFIDDPRGTMAQLALIAEAECDLRTARVDFDDQRILDIGPYLVWGLMHRHMAPFMVGGAITNQVMKALDAMQLLHYMGMARPQWPLGSHDLYAFPLRQRREAGSSTSTDLVTQAPTFSKVADDLVDTVDKWLGVIKPPMGLTHDGKALINSMATEILNNAERHSQMGSNNDGDWMVAGFMGRRPIEEAKDEGRDAWYDCHFAFISVGDTISETITQAEDKWVREDAVRYSDRHLSGLKKKPFSHDTLLTVYALQDGISRLSQDKSRGGVGMMDIMDWAAELGQTDDVDHNPQVTIISGNSVVMFRGSYPRGIVEGSNSRRLQCFNPENSLELPPNGDYVYNIPHRMPGTVIAVRFSLDGKFLSQKLDNSYGN